MRLNKWMILGVASLMLLFTVAAAGFAFAKKTPPPPAPIDVIVSNTKMMTVPDTLAAFGSMEAMQEVDLSFVVDGHLTALLVHSGQLVQKGQEIADLDDSVDLAQLKALQATLDLNRSTYQRMLELQQYGGISAEAVDQSKAEWVSAEAEVQQQEALIAQKKLYAPFTGVLGVFQYDVGAYVPHGTAVVHLVQQAPLQVRYTVPATYKSSLELGQIVYVRSNVYPDKVFTGVLNFISPTVNANSGTVTLLSKVDNPDYLLAPGMFVSVRQVLNPNRQLLMLPDVALMTDIVGQYVFKVTGNKVQKTYVQVGVLTNNLAQIVSGLKEGDEVVTAGQQKLVDGSLINIINTAPIEPIEPIAPLPVASSSTKVSS